MICQWLSEKSSQTAMNLHDCSARFFRDCARKKRLRSRQGANGLFRYDKHVGLSFWIAVQITQMWFFVFLCLCVASSYAQTPTSTSLSSAPSSPSPSATPIVFSPQTLADLK